MIEAAEATIAKLRTGRTYFENRPSLLDVMAAVSRRFPESGVVWASTFTLHDGGRGTLTGRAANQQAILSVRDALMADPNFSAINLLDSRESAGTDRGQISFSLSFTYVPLAPAAPGEVASDE